MAASDLRRLALAQGMLARGGDQAERALHGVWGDAARGWLTHTAWTSPTAEDERRRPEAHQDSHQDWHTARSAHDR